MKDQKGMPNSEPLYAVNKTARKAFRRDRADAPWEPVDPGSVSLSADQERVGHEKIEDNWFSVYKAGARGK